MHALLNPRAARVHQPHDGPPVAQRLLLHAGNLVGMCLAQGAAEHGKILRIGVHHPPGDAAAAGDHAVCGGDSPIHAKVRAAMAAQAADFHKAARIKEQSQPFTGGELALFALRRNTLRPAAALRQSAPLEKLRSIIFSHRSNPFHPENVPGQGHACLRVLYRGKRAGVNMICSILYIIFKIRYNLSAYSKNGTTPKRERRPAMQPENGVPFSHAFMAFNPRQRRQHGTTQPSLP